MDNWKLGKSTYLGSSFAEERAISLAWRQTKSVAALAKMTAEFERDQSRIRAGFDTSKITATQITLPTTENVEQRFDAFAQKLGHSVDTLKEIARLFYPELPRKWIDALTSVPRHGTSSLNFDVSLRDLVLERNISLNVVRVLAEKFTYMLPVNDGTVSPLTPSSRKTIRIFARVASELLPR